MKRRYLILMMAMGFGMSGVTLACAEEVQGVVESIDAASHAIVVKNAATGATKNVTVHPNVLSSLKVGSKVKVALPSGGTTADTIEVEM